MEKRVEIDTRAPFQSVKEAILLFGERVLAGEIYGNKIKEASKWTPANERDGQNAGTNSSSLLSSSIVAAELEHTKRMLKESREESQAMSECLNSVIEELQETKKQLESLMKVSSESGLQDQTFHPFPGEFLAQVITDDIKFVEEETKQELKEMEQNCCRKKYVTFVNVDPAPTIAQVMSGGNSGEYCYSFDPLNNCIHDDQKREDNMLPATTNRKKNKKKKKPLIPLLGGIFSKKKNQQSSAASCSDIN